MKHKMPKKPTRAQKEMIKAAGYKWDNWLVLNEDNISLTLIHKHTGTKKVVLC